jgi:hypothetical protein
MTLKLTRSLTNLILATALISMTSGSFPVRAEEDEDHETHERRDKPKPQPPESVAHCYQPGAAKF